MRRSVAVLLIAVALLLGVELGRELFHTRPPMRATAAQEEYCRYWVQPEGPK